MVWMCAEGIRGVPGLNAEAAVAKIVWMPSDERVREGEQERSQKLFGGKERDKEEFFLTSTACPMNGPFWEALRENVP